MANTAPIQIQLIRELKRNEAGPCVGRTVASPLAAGSPGCIMLFL
jgi:hypothetical protein